MMHNLRGSEETFNGDDSLTNSDTVNYIAFGLTMLVFMPIGRIIYDSFYLESSTHY